MALLTPYLLVQCLAGLLGWAVIATEGRTGLALLEAGLAFAAPLALAGAAGVPADGVACVAAAGMAFCLVNWAWQAMKRPQ